MISLLMPFLSRNVIVGIVAVTLVGFMFTFQAIQKQAAFDKGVDAGKGAAATAAVESVTKTAEAERQAEVEVGMLDDKSDIIALCKRSASCKERRTLK